MNNKITYWLIEKFHHIKAACQRTILEIILTDAMICRRTVFRNHYMLYLNDCCKSNQQVALWSQS